MAINTDYIRGALERFEGKGVAKGYVPADKSGKPLGVSGVTVASGLDLGQQTSAGLRAMGISDKIISRLAPYIGIKGTAAQALLARNPLRLTADEVTAIDTAVHAAYINTAAGLFGRVSFAAAPKEAQAVAVSLHYQFGKPERAASPALANAWNAMRLGEYAKAAKILSDPLGWSQSHQQYMKRRLAEAALLEAIK